MSTLAAPGASGRARPGGWAALLAGLAGLGYLSGTGYAAPALAAAVALVVAAGIVVWPERAALALLVVVPFCVYPVAVGGFSVFLALPVALGAAGGVALLARPRRGVVALPLLPYGALLALAVVSAIQSGDPTTGGSRVVYLVAFGLFAWALAALISSGVITPEAVAKAIAAGAALAAVALLAQFAYGVSAGREPVTRWLADVHPLFGGQRTGAAQFSNWWIPDLSLTRAIFPFMAAPSAGGAMMFGLLAAVWLRRPTAAARARSAWPAIVLALCSLALLATFSRQAWLGTVAGLLVLGARRGRRGTLAVLALAGVLVALAPVPGHGGSFASYLVSSADTASTSTGTRIGLWRGAVGFVGERPLLGVGPGQYGSLNPDPLNHPVFYAHNVVLDMAVETGVLAAIALLALFAVAIVRAWGRRADLAAALLVAYLVAGLFDDVLYFPRNGFLLAAAFALAAARRPAGTR
jgi:O-antigen ligase